VAFFVVSTGSGGDRIGLKPEPPPRPAKMTITEKIKEFLKNV